MKLKQYGDQPHGNVMDGLRGKVKGEEAERQETERQFCH